MLEITIPSTSPDAQGDIFFNGHATSGQYVGWINTGNSANDWKRFGLISRSATETFVTPDRIGINTFGTLRGLPSAGITSALLDVRGGGVFDALRVIGNVDFVNGATFASIQFGETFITGITSFIGTTDSTNVTTGIVTVAGGVGIKKSLNVGGNFKVSGISTFVGNVTFEGGTISLGDSNTDNVVFTADVNSNILPNTNATFDIGDASLGKRWRNASFSGIVTATSFSGDGSNLTNTGSTLSAGSGTQRIVLTSQTSGTMTASATTADLTFNNTTNALVCTGTIAATSDEKLKENVITIENALKKVLSLRGVEYDRTDSGDHQIGVIAQEVEKVVPAVVYGDEIKSVAYGNLIGLLIEAIKEQQKEIEEIKKKLV
jgi:hypothetical protein